MYIRNKWYNTVPLQGPTTMFLWPIQLFHACHHISKNAKHPKWITLQSWKLVFLSHTYCIILGGQTDKFDRESITSEKKQTFFRLGDVYLAMQVCVYSTYYYQLTNFSFQPCDHWIYQKWTYWDFTVAKIWQF